MRLVESFRVTQVEFGGLQVVFVIKTRHFVQDLNIHTLIRLQTNSQFVLRQFLPGFFEQVQFRIFEVDHHFGAFCRQTFPGTQVERHAGPAPVVDIHADRHKRFGVAGLVRALFFQIARDFFPLGKTCGVLAAHGFLTHVGAVNTAQ